MSQRALVCPCVRHPHLRDVPPPFALVGRGVRFAAVSCEQHAFSETEAWRSSTKTCGLFLPADRLPFVLAATRTSFKEPSTEALTTCVAAVYASVMLTV